MKKRFLKIAAAISMTLMLTGCMPGPVSVPDIKTYKDNTVSFSNIGPNDRTETYFYRRLVGQNGEKDTIARMDVETATDTLYKVDLEGSSGIATTYVCGDGMLFIIPRPTGDGIHRLMYIDGDGNISQVFESKHNMTITGDGERVVIIDHYHDPMEFDPEKVEVFPSPGNEKNGLNIVSLNDGVPERRYSMQDGTEVKIRKTFGEDNFAYEVAGYEMDLECLSGKDFKYAQWGELSDEDGVIYGVVAITKNSPYLHRWELGPGGFSTNDVKREMLFTIDIESGENKILYETKKGRIVGYTPEFVYIYRNAALYKVNIASGEEEKLGKVNCGTNNHINFRWEGSKVFIMDTLSGEYYGVIEG